MHQVVQAFHRPFPRTSESCMAIYHGRERRNREKLRKLAQEEDRRLLSPGDLNDVAWSPRNRRFVRISRLFWIRARDEASLQFVDARFFFLRGLCVESVLLNAPFQGLLMKRFAVAWFGGIMSLTAVLASCGYLMAAPSVNRTPSKSF